MNSSIGNFGCDRLQQEVKSGRLYIQLKKLALGKDRSSTTS